MSVASERCGGAVGEPLLAAMLLWQPVGHDEDDLALEGVDGLLGSVAAIADTGDSKRKAQRSIVETVGDDVELRLLEQGVGRDEVLDMWCDHLGLQPDNPMTNIWSGLTNPEQRAHERSERSVLGR